MFGGKLGRIFTQHQWPLSTACCHQVTTSAFKRAGSGSARPLAHLLSLSGSVGFILRHMLKATLRSVRYLLRFIWHLPTNLRVAIDLAEATEDAARGHFLAAEKRLLRVFGLSVPGSLGRTPAHLLLALVSLRLGNVAAAAELAPVGVAHVASLRKYANTAERDYLAYVGKLLFEEATEKLDRPATLTISVRYEDLRLEHVRSELTDVFKVYRSSWEPAPGVH